MNFQKLTQQILESVENSGREIYYNIITEGSLNTFMDEAIRLDGTKWYDIWDNSEDIMVYNTFDQGAAVLSRDCGFTTKERELFKQSFEPYLHLNGKWKSMDTHFLGSLITLYGIEIDRISGIRDAMSDVDNNIMDW